MLRIVFVALILSLFPPLSLSASPLPATISSVINKWTATGPEGGDINDLAVDPLTPTTLYAGTDAGEFKSTNSGGNWSAANTLASYMLPFYHQAD